MTLNFNDIQNISIMKLRPDMFNLGMCDTQQSLEKMASQILFEDEDGMVKKTSRIFKSMPYVKPVVVNSNVTDCITINDTGAEEKEYIVLET